MTIRELREQREQTFLLIFEKIFQQELDFTDLAQSAHLSQSYSPNDNSINTARSIYENLDEIDDIISKNARGWRLERLSKVALSILRLAIYEMKYSDNIPISVSINEAVELAKIYTTKDDASFINGLLGTFARSEAEGHE